MADVNTAALAEEIDRRIRALPDQSTGQVRRIRREYSRRLRDAPASEVQAVADALVGRQRWVAYELLYEHPSRLSGLTITHVERLGAGFDGWQAVDTFARYVSGPAWQQGLIPDEAIHRWARSPDRFWRRAALVSSVPLNLRAAGGQGDTRRTLEVCRLLVADHDDTIVKALSWALRALAYWDPEAVRGFLAEHDRVVAARVKREVGNKLETGLKNPKRPVAPE
jgi:3-methyladenine DNA glycosylase AlkD